MKFIRLMLAALVIGNSNLSAQENGLLVHSNEPIQFDKVNASVIKDAVNKVMQLSDERIKKISSINKNERTTANVLYALDELQYNISDLLMKLGLMGVTYVDDSTRNAANDEAGVLGNYANNIYLNEDLYKALKEFSNSSSAGSLKADEKKFLLETLIAFEKNGMKLDAQGRKDIAALTEKLTKLGIDFDKNIAQSKDSVEFTERELLGIDENTKGPWKRSNGIYMVYVNGPNYAEIMTNADHDSTRRTMYVHYNNRAYPGNIAVLDSLFYYRNEFAKRLGFNSYAAYSVIDKMSGSPATVWHFENDLIAKLTPHVTNELNELKQLKHSLHPDLDNDINDWDISYYKKKLLDTKYKLNIDDLKQYFEMNNTLQGMFMVYEKLLGIDIRPTENIPVWYSKVKTFEVYKDGKKAGSFYLDLFPRPNKYTHFACFPISQYRQANGKEVLPVAALVCNFPEGNANEPSLLYHSDVITLFHEFGHLIHMMLGRSEIASQGPFAVKSDFVEAPSQFLENWVWEYEPLSMFAKNYKTGEPLPKSLYDKMKATQQVDEAIYYIRQLYLGLLDLTYEDKYDSIRNESLMKVANDLYTMRQIPFPEGSHFIASFTHLNGYAANYYGYLWSRVFAEDMFSIFRKNGVMNKATGLRYRKIILENAATKDELEILCEFLGREPDSNAFLQSLGVQ